MPELNFNNTEIAFAHKSNAELKKARLLFKSFNFPWLIKYGPKLAAAFVNFLPPLKNLIKNTLFAQFCGGESIDDCEKVTTQLHKSRIGTILDYSVEGEESELVFDHTCMEIIDTINKAAGKRDSIPFSVFKTTGIGRMELLTKVSAGLSLSNQESSEFERVKKRFESICLEAYNKEVRLFVDAEDSWIQNIIDDMTYEAMKKYNSQKAIIYNTVQCYRKDRLLHIENQIKQLHVFIGFKLVRGAYMEKERERAIQLGYESPIHLTKEDTDREYDGALEFCMKHIEKISICAGTHNEKSSLYLVNLLTEYHIPKSHPHVYFAQLLGMSDHISYNLANAGFNVSKYVPYGPVKAVLPYLSRRAQENSSVKGQVGRELNLINLELKRRK